VSNPDAEGKITEEKRTIKEKRGGGKGLWQEKGGINQEESKVTGDRCRGREYG